MTIDRETVIRLLAEAEKTTEWPIASEYGTLVMLKRERTVRVYEKFAALVLEHGRKPLPVSKDGMAVIIDGVPVPVEVVRRVERAHGITNKESSDAE